MSSSHTSPMPSWSKSRWSVLGRSGQLSQVLSLSPVVEPSDGWNWAWSEATWEHKAFQYWAPKGMLAVPLNTYRFNYYQGDDGRYYYDYDWVSKLIIVNVTEESLEIHGEVDHSHLYETEENHWWNSYNIRRSIFMGDYIYAISHAGVTVTHLDSLEEVDFVQLVKVQVESESNSSDYSETEGATRDEV